MSVERPTHPGWIEIAAALATYVCIVLGLATWLFTAPEDQAVLKGIVGMAVNGIAGAIALIVANIVRIRDIRVFGFRKTSHAWLLIGAVLGIVAFGLSLVIEWAYFLFITEPNTQGDFQAAARAGFLPLMLLLFSGALLTPFGEEVVFRGVIANALNRYGAWAGVLGSAAFFGIVHGPSVILLDAFMVGILTGIVFRKTQSIWPGVLLHIVYNGIWLVQYSIAPYP
jgi:uncharacterized protein